ncbi:Arsenate reductase and related proteins, glutaredoxin family [hydrothermal vent metagenome]|uniref:Arsenate reductase and related proteins, glutaredoxin family n=1 Tax=hydrothermal vent metagenome TaxID=652676 RepID=A0A1W1EC94_9ZZZZ
MIKIYGIKTCDGVRKAIKFLKTNEIPYEFVDFRVTPVDLNTINHWLKYSDIKTLFNSRSTTYRKLKLKDMNLNDEEKITWLAKENTLIKRPVIELENNVIIGYDEDIYLEKLIDKKG